VKRKQALIGYHHASGVVLFREDLDAAVTLLSDKGYRVTISDSDHEFENLNEATRHLGQRPRSLSVDAREISGAYESVSINMRGDSIDITWSTADRASSVGHSLRDMCVARRSRIYRLLSPSGWGFACMVAGISAPPIAGAPLPIRAAEYIACAVLVALAAASFAYRLRFTSVRLIPRHNGGFWRRNSDKVWLVLLGAVLTEVITWLVGLLAGHK